MPQEASGFGKYTRVISNGSKSKEYKTEHRNSHSMATIITTTNDNKDETWYLRHSDGDSSDPSAQSMRLSQRDARGMQVPSRQRNSFGPQPSSTRTNTSLVVPDGVEQLDVVEEGKKGLSMNNHYKLTEIHLWYYAWNEPMPVRKLEIFRDVTQSTDVCVRDVVTYKFLFSSIHSFMWPARRQWLKATTRIIQFWYLVDMPLAKIITSYFPTGKLSTGYRDAISCLDRRGPAMV